MGIVFLYIVCADCIIEQKYLKMKISYFARKSKPSKHLDIPFHKICDIVATTVHTAVFTFEFFWFWQFFSKFDLDFYHTESQSKKAKVKKLKTEFQRGRLFTI